MIVGTPGRIAALGATMDLHQRLLVRATGLDCPVKSWPTSQKAGRRKLYPTQPV
jgi:hypothetical protein